LMFAYCPPSGTFLDLVLVMNWWIAQYPIKLKSTSNACPEFNYWNNTSMILRIPDNSPDECGLQHHANALAQRGRFRELLNPGQLSKLDLDAEEESLVKGLQEVVAV
jgi:hypothetical protein